MITLANTVTAEVLDLINSKIEEGAANPARLRVYAGPRPTYPENAPSGQTQLLATFDLPNDLFGPSNTAPGGASAGAFVDDIPPANVTTSGDAEWFRVLNRDGVAIMDGEVSDMAGSGDLKIDQTNLIAGRRVSIIEWTAIFPQ